MSPTLLILYVVIVTLVLTLVLPRLTEPSPAMRRALIVASAVGAIVLLVVTLVL